MYIIGKEEEEEEL